MRWVRRKVPCYIESRDAFSTSCPRRGAAVKAYSLSHLSDQTLLNQLTSLVSRDRATTAELVAHIAEVDARRLYLPAACSSMFVYCVRVLGLSEEAAFKRIHAGRAARRFPAIFEAMAEGRLHLSAVVMLAPHLTDQSADEFLACAARKTKSQIEQILAQRFPRPDLPTCLKPIRSAPEPASVPTPTATSTPTQHAPGRVEVPCTDTSVGAPTGATQAQHAPGRVESNPASRIAPLSAEKFALQLTMSRSTHDKLRHAQALMSHQIRSGNVAEVLDRALDALIAQLEKRKLAATSRPRATPRAASGPRHVPADVRRAVWSRDEGRCTFVSECGHRCASRTQIEFDHVTPVAHGGRATVSGIRLRCRAHNQYEAERAFGSGFMNEKRGAARRVASEGPRAANLKAT